MTEFVKLTEYIQGNTNATPIEYIFPINPSNCDIAESKRITRTTISGRDGAIFQNLGRDPMSIKLSGTLVSGYSYKNQASYDAQLLIQDFQRMTRANSIFRLAGIFTNFTGAINVIIPNYGLSFRATKPKQYEYNLQLNEWTDFTINSGIVTRNLTSQQVAVKYFNNALRRSRLRRVST